MFSEFSFSRVSESTSLFSFPLGGIFISPSIDTKQEGKTAVSDFSKRHRQSEVNKIAKGSKRRQVASNHRPINSPVLEPNKDEDSAVYSTVLAKFIAHCKSRKKPSLNDISTSSKTKLRIRVAKYDFAKHTDFLRGKAT